jgi:alpha-D-xyloside xylohydrolase
VGLLDTTADDPADLLRQYGEAAGRTPMLAEWALGFWQCKLRYKAQDELPGIAREYKAAWAAPGSSPS